MLAFRDDLREIDEVNRDCNHGKVISSSDILPDFNNRPGITVTRTEKFGDQIVFK
jgi:hypothetical protein